MAIIDHWHPVLKSNELRNKPVAIQLGGHGIVLYRTRSGTLTALADECPHRRLRLSLGEVVGEKLRCRYHGWTFDCAGRGESPGTPKLQACVTAYDAAEAFGAIWVKSKHSTPEFPRIDAPGYLPICTLRRRALAPLELVLDNPVERGDAAGGAGITAVKDSTSCQRDRQLILGPPPEGPGKAVARKGTRARGRSCPRSRRAAWWATAPRRSTTCAGGRYYESG